MTFYNHYNAMDLNSATFIFKSEIMQAYIPIAKSTLVKRRPRTPMPVELSPKGVTARPEMVGRDTHKLSV